MSELQNPLFDEEKEFLERKKLEYERALRGDVEHIKERSMAVGKVAAVGAGLAGGIWLIAKAFGGKKRKRNRAEDDDDWYDNDRHNGPKDYQQDDPEDYQHNASEEYQQDGPDGYFGEENDGGSDDDFDAEYYTAGNGKRYKSKKAPRSAMNSAHAFAQQAQPHEAPSRTSSAATAAPNGPSAQPASFGAAGVEDDPFQDLPYDDSRRLPVSHAFDGDEAPQPAGASARPNMLGTMLQTFLKSETGKMVLAQGAALVLAAATKKAGEFFPAAKNSDLADSSGPAPVAPGAFPVASPAPSVSSDASTHPQSL